MYVFWEIVVGKINIKIFIKCIFQVEFRADNLHLQLLKLAKEGNRLITSSGFISFSCRPVEPVRPVAFTSEESHVVRKFN